MAFAGEVGAELQQSVKEHEQKVEKAKGKPTTMTMVANKQRSQ